MTKGEQQALLVSSLVRFQSVHKLACSVVQLFLSIPSWALTSQVSFLQSSAHSDVVNAVAWRPGSQVLYSGSSDQHVAEWSVAKGECVTYVS